MNKLYDRIASAFVQFYRDNNGVDVPENEAYATAFEIYSEYMNDVANSLKDEQKHIYDYKEYIEFLADYLFYNEKDNFYDVMTNDKARILCYIRACKDSLLKQFAAWITID